MNSLAYWEKESCPVFTGPHNKDKTLTYTELSVPTASTHIKKKKNVILLFFSDEVSNAEHARAPGYLM